MVAVEDAEVDVVEVAVVAAEDAGADAKDVTGPVRIAAIVTDPVKTAAMTAAMIAVRTVAMDLVQAVAPADPGAEEAAEARRNSAWTRRPSLLWARLPLKVRSSTLQFPGPSHDSDRSVSGQGKQEIPNYYFFIQSEY